MLPAQLSPCWCLCTFLQPPATLNTAVRCLILQLKKSSTPPEKATSYSSAISQKPISCSSGTSSTSARCQKGFELLVCPSHGRWHGGGWVHLSCEYPMEPMLGDAAQLVCEMERLLLSIRSVTRCGFICLPQSPGVQRRLCKSDHLCVPSHWAKRRTKAYREKEEKL